MPENTTAKVIWKGSEAHTSKISISVDRLGVASVTEVRECKDEKQAASELGVVAEDCPLGLARPRVTSTAADRLEAGMWQVTREFSAILDEDLIGLTTVFKGNTTANREPIETHPQFNYFAGKRNEEVNGAVFDEKDGSFDRFKPFITTGDKYTDKSGAMQTATSTFKNRKGGVTDYLVPIAKITEERLFLLEDLPAPIEELTAIVPAPDSLITPVYSKRTWLLTAADPVWVGREVYKLTREWSASGPRGWDVDIYPK